MQKRIHTMKKLIFLIVIFSSFNGIGQEYLNNLLAAGIQDAHRFATEYTAPAAKALMYNAANGWIQSAEVKAPLKFDISLIGNVSFIKEKQKSFLMHTADYNNLRFRDGSSIKEVATAFGENDPAIIVFSTVENGLISEDVEFRLPQGLASASINMMPTGFVQGRLGLFKATELKVRFLPKIKHEDVKVGLFGIGVQHEFTQWLPAENIFPIAISGLIAYSNLNGKYDFTQEEIVVGQDDRFELTQNSWILQLQTSTKFKIFNVYGGIGYVSGKSEFAILGTYRVKSGIPLLENSDTFVDPISVKTKISGVRGTIGANLKLGFFAVHADYNIAEFNNASVGLHFGI